MEPYTASWLTETEPWITYRALIDLYDLSEDNPLVKHARQDMLADGRINGLIAELQNWPGTILKAHNDASHLLHKLVFLADLGMNKSDPGMQAIIQKILSNQSIEGIYQVRVNIKPAYGGTGEDQYAWMLCDAPLITYSLLKFGLSANEQVQASIKSMANLIRDNGWPCTVSPQLGKFRGPGRKSDPCPYATLAMLRLLSALPSQEQYATRTGAETLLTLWQQRKERKAYLFGMGTDFRKLKAPLIWYDLLHFLDVLTNFTWLFQDQRLQEMLDLLQSKADDKGRFTPESIWMAWKDWEFGQKKQPSAWITLIANRTLKRTGRLPESPTNPQ
ncbi:MAG TPA: hypothetical protein VLM80_12250 [Anaerolineales bacterium]|nr:hypothetical protein [Anaerolineales bacterium]